MNETFLSLDLSTKATGWALFCSKYGTLLDYGVLKSSTRGTSKMSKLEAKFVRMERLYNELYDLTLELNPDFIVIEEVTRGKNRIAQKTLCMFHGFVITTLNYWLRKDRIFFEDVSAWRKNLGIRLSDVDKIHNKKVRKLGQKKEVIGWKDLSCRWANKKFTLDLNSRVEVTDGDRADAICVGYSFFACTSNDKGV